MYLLIDFNYFLRFLLSVIVAIVISFRILLYDALEKLYKITLLALQPTDRVSSVKSFLLRKRLVGCNDVLYIIHVYRMLIYIYIFNFDLDFGAIEILSFDVILLTVSFFRFKLYAVCIY